MALPAPHAPLCADDHVPLVPRRPDEAASVRPDQIVPCDVRPRSLPAVLKGECLEARSEVARRHGLCVDDGDGLVLLLPRIGLRLVEVVRHGSRVVGLSRPVPLVLVQVPSDACQARIVLAVARTVQRGGEVAALTPLPPIPPRPSCDEERVRPSTVVERPVA